MFLNDLDEIFNNFCETNKKVWGNAWNFLIYLEINFYFKKGVDFIEIYKGREGRKFMLTDKSKKFIKDKFN